MLIANMMAGIVVDPALTQIIVQNVCVLTMLITMEFLMLMLEMVFVMMKQTMLNATMIMVTVVCLSSTENTAQNVNVLTMASLHRLDFPTIMALILP